MNTVVVGEGLKHPSSHTDGIPVSRVHAKEPRLVRELSVRYTTARTPGPSGTPSSASTSGRETSATSRRNPISKRRPEAFSREAFTE